MNKLIIVLLASIFLISCAPLNYNPSPEQRKIDKEYYEQWQRDKLQRDILQELKKQNRRIK